MPVYNGAKYISIALESLLSQSYKNFELIISDNCSNDQTYAICEQIMLKDDRIKLIKQKENIGALSNFEFVLRMATGKYFMWASHDDFWDLNWLSNSIKAFDEGVVMVTSEIVGVDDFGKQISSPLKLEFKGNLLYRLSRYFLMPEWKGKANIIYSLIITANAKKYKFPTNVGFYGFDMHFIFYLLNQGECIFTEGRSLYKRVPQIQLKSFDIKDINNNFMLLKRNLRYIFSYIKITESAFASCLIAILIPIKLLSLSYYSIKSILRYRFSKR